MQGQRRLWTIEVQQTKKLISVESRKKLISVESRKKSLLIVVKEPKGKKEISASLNKTFDILNWQRNISVYSKGEDG